MGADENPINKVKADVETEFVGYTSTTTNGKVVVIATDEDFVDELTTGTKGYILPTRLLSMLKWVVKLVILEIIRSKMVLLMFTTLRKMLVVKQFIMLKLRRKY